MRRYHFGCALYGEDFFFADKKQIVSTRKDIILDVLHGDDFFADNKPIVSTRYHYSLSIKYVKF